MQMDLSESGQSGQRTWPVPSNSASSDPDRILQPASRDAQPPSVPPAPRNAQERSQKNRNNSARSELAEKLGTVYLENDTNSDSSFIQAPTTPCDPSGRPGVFPPAYSVIRATKSERLMASKLGGLGDLSRAPGATGYPRAGIQDPKDCRTFSAQNYHCVEKALNISLSVGLPGAGGRDDLPCIGCTTPHSIAEKLSRGAPVAIILSDQNFPATLPASDSNCVIVVRVEDGLLSEIENAFYDRFRAFLHPHGSLSPGSAILIGSVAHLHAKGLADYGEALVNSMAGLRSKAGPGVKVSPLVNIPIQGIDSAATVRGLFDLDCWLGGMPPSVGNTFQATRKVFWDMVMNSMETELREGGEAYTIMLPMNLKNKRKVPVTSDPVDGHFPSSVPPLCEKSEGTILKSLLGEINAAFGHSLDLDPDISRSNTPPPGLDNSRLVVIGASHMTRVANALIMDGEEEVYNLSTPGWKPNKENLEKAAEYCTGLKLSNSDTVILDLWSNSAFMGTDEIGLPSVPYKCNLDGRYHVLGALQAAPRPLLQKILREAENVLAACGEAKVLFVVPFPRYLSGKCCESDSHLTNFGSQEIIVETCRVMEIVSSLIEDLGNDKYGTYNVTDQFGIDRDLSSMCCAAGEPVWSVTDSVHMSPAAYSEVAATLVAICKERTAVSSCKRARRESVVPGPPPKRRGGPMVRPSPWVTGSAAHEGRGGGRGRGRGATRGRGNYSSFIPQGRGNGRWTRARGRGRGHYGY